MKEIHDKLQKISMQPPSDDSYEHMKILKAEIAELEARKEIMWK